MKRALLCTLIAAALLLGACSRASESTVRAPDAGAPLTLCLGAGPVTLDPARTENGIGATYVVNLFAGLTGYRTGGDGTAELTPELCTALPEPEALPDGRVRYVFTLRDGLTWSDGTPLTAADFVYAWNRASTLEDAAAPYLFACIDGYGTGWLNVAASPDGRTLTVVLAEAMPTFLQLCAQPAYAPVPSGAADATSWTADGAAFAASGPYTVAEWTTEGLTYTKNPAYWDADNVAAEMVRFVFQADPNVSESAFLAREYALSWPVPDAALDDLRANHAPELRTVSQLGTYSLCFSMSDPALSVFSQTERAQIRTALALLIDRSYLCSEITPGAQQSANPAAGADALADHETPKLRRRLFWSLGFLLILMYFSMGHMMWGWPLPRWFDGNHIAMGLVQLLLAGIVMVINQKFFINGFKGLLHGSPNMDTLVAMGSMASFVWSTYALFAMTRAQVDGNSELVMHYMMEFYFESAAMILSLIHI